MAESYIGASVTFISGALETAGYLTQAKFLAIFQDLLNTTGAYLYVLTCVMGIVMYAVFGRYEYIRYLVLGPILFILMLTWTVESDGVAYQLGAKHKPRDLNGKETSKEKASKEAVKVANADNAGTDVASGASGVIKDKIKIAGFFEFYVKPIDALVSELVEIILKSKEDEALLNMQRSQVLEALVQLELKDVPLLALYLNSYAPNCHSNLFTTNVNNEDNVKTLQGDKKDRKYNIQPKEALEWLKLIIDSPPKNPPEDTPSNDKILVDLFAKVKAIKDLEDSGKISETTTLNCIDMWTVIKYGAVNDLKDQQGEIFNRHTSNVNDQGKAKGTLCRDLEEKLKPTAGAKDLKDSSNPNPDPEPECDITQTVLAYMIQNTTRKHNNTIINNILSRADTIGHHTTTGKNENINPERSVDISSAEDAVGWVENQRKQTEMYRKQIYSFAMNLPYWQGLILFFLASAYPFMCLVLILPNRAPTFITMVLAWFWIKSWDIGIAAVYLLSQVLWNLLPQIDWPLKDTSLNEMTFEDIYKKGFEYDPSFSLHTYYMMVSMALLAVPGITGYVILKGKKSILSTYTSAAARMANESGELAALTYQTEFSRNMVAQNIRDTQASYESYLKKYLPNLGMISNKIRGDSNITNKDEAIENAILNCGTNLLRAFGYYDDDKKVLDDEKKKWTGADDAGANEILKEISKQCGLYGKDVLTSKMLYTAFSNIAAGQSLAKSVEAPFKKISKFLANTLEVRAEHEKLWGQNGRTSRKIIMRENYANMFTDGSEIQLSMDYFEGSLKARAKLTQDLFSDRMSIILNANSTAAKEMAKSLKSDNGLYNTAWGLIAIDNLPKYFERVFQKSTDITLNTNGSNSSTIQQEFDLGVGRLRAPLSGTIQYITGATSKENEDKPAFPTYYDNNNLNQSPQPNTNNEGQNSQNPEVLNPDSSQVETPNPALSKENGEFSGEFATTDIFGNPIVFNANDTTLDAKFSGKKTSSMFDLAVFNAEDKIKRGRGGKT
ncbi:MAG: hypothetical protein LBE20_02400 [Deltaproteobacteria bacterium]|jgi:hypothetical protein|nr:hypothetical protein [Deltaproteobacteria bacterium]